MGFFVSLVFQFYPPPSPQTSLADDLSQSSAEISALSKNNDEANKRAEMHSRDARLAFQVGGGILRASLRFEKRLNFAINPRKLSIF